MGSEAVKVYKEALPKLLMELKSKNEEWVPSYPITGLISLDFHTIFRWELSERTLARLCSEWPFLDWMLHLRHINWIRPDRFTLCPVTMIMLTQQFERLELTATDSNWPRRDAADRFLKWSLRISLHLISVLDPLCLTCQRLPCLRESA